MAWIYQYVENLHQVKPIPWDPSMGRGYTFFLISIGLTLAVSVTSWCLFIASQGSRMFKDVKCWMVNVDDIAYNAKPASQRSTWRGISRQLHLSPSPRVRLTAHTISIPIEFIVTSISRRVQWVFYPCLDLRIY